MGPFLPVGHAAGRWSGRMRTSWGGYGSVRPGAGGVCGLEILLLQGSVNDG